MASASVFGIATLVIDFLYDSLSTSPPLSLLLRCGAGIFVGDVHCMDSKDKTKIKQYKQHIYNLILHRIPSMMSGSSKSLSSFVARECARHSFEKKTSKRAMQESVPLKRKHPRGLRHTSKLPWRVLKYHGCHLALLLGDQCE